jgi:hypothetical protein
MIAKCPKCEAVLSPGVDSCPSCGVIPSKYRPSMRARDEAYAAADAGAAFVSRVPLCQDCKGPGPLAHVELNQNIGAVYMRFTKRISAELCRRCLDKHFWSTTLITTLVGWLGIISIVVAPIYVIGNVVAYSRARMVLGKAAAR